MSVTLKEENQLGIVEFNQPDSKVNVLNGETLKKLDSILELLKEKPHLKAVLFVSTKKDVFIAGADIKEIEKITDPADGATKAKAGQDVFNKIEDLKVPTIAVIDGVALGGGCELALACEYRIATFNEKVRIGLPEVNLGFVPGFGGTYRMPRLLGLAEGLKMVLSGSPINSDKALRNGLVDRLVPQVGLDKHVQKLVNEIASGKTLKPKFKRNQKKGMQKFLETSAIGQSIIFKESRKSVLKMTKGFYPAPLKAIDVIEKGIRLSRRQALDFEAKSFGQLAITDISKSLINVFYTSEKYKKFQPEGMEHVKPREIKKAAVLGAGIMGGGIAQLFAARDIWTRLKDINHDAIAKGLKAAYKIFQGDVKKRKLNQAVAEAKMAQITGTLDYSGMNSVDLVVEAVVEKMEIKQKVFQDLSNVTNEQTILASNTSALSVTEMSQGVKNPGRVIGIHFFNPVHRMPLVEVITTPSTSPETIMTTLNLIKRVGKTPILVKDSCGFIVNRILLCYINEAGRCYEEAGDMVRIDKAMTDFGMPMGPFTLSDEVGLDVGVKVLHILHNGLGERFKPVEIFEKIYAKGLLGKKSGKGYYIHEEKKERVPNPEVASLLTPKGSPFNSEEFVNRMVLMMINEAAMCLDEKIISEAAGIDVGMIFGTGFPPFRGGLLYYADRIGIKNVIAQLDALQKKYNSDRFKPCRYLLQLQEKGKSFYN